jgi:hypothetical protein
MGWVGRCPQYNCALSRGYKSLMVSGPVLRWLMPACNTAGLWFLLLETRKSNCYGHLIIICCLFFSLDIYILIIIFWCLSGCFALCSATVPQDLVKRTFEWEMVVFLDKLVCFYLYIVFLPIWFFFVKFAGYKIKNLSHWKQKQSLGMFDRISFKQKLGLVILTLRPHCEIQR